MAMQFTEDQQRAIRLRDRNILVSAAAGSGKTAVLVERILSLVSGPDDGTDIDRLLVVTFTNAAAAQMRERIEQALSQRAQQEPDNARLQRQLVLLHNAQITTIDSFCLYLIRNHFNDIGLDPDFRTADEGERRLLCQDVLKELLEEKFAQADGEFLHCVECFVPGGREEGLEELILQIYEFSMSCPWPEEWLESHRTDYDTDTVEALTAAPWFGQLLRIVQTTLASCQKKTEDTIRLCEEPGGPYMYLPALKEDLEQIGLLARTLPDGAGGRDEALQSAEDVRALFEGMNRLSFAKLTPKRDMSVLTQKRELAKRNREQVKKSLLSLREDCFGRSLPGYLADMEKAAPALRALVDLVLDFKRRFDAKKREKNLLDFSDMEHMALEILLDRREDGTVCPSRTALEYREHFREILVDEYQDSNLVQELLLQSISGEEDGRFDRFMVGDVKQSIYKFRLARPEIFMEKFGRYQKDGTSCARVDLKQNFRSRREVTDCVNEVFSRLMHAEVGGVEYDEDAALSPAAVYPSAPQETDGDSLASPYEPELLLALTQESGAAAREQEARMIAARIHELAGSFLLRDEKTGGLRKASYGDMVILLRTAAGWDDRFKKVLEEEGIPVHVASRTGYFSAREVQDTLNFLRVLNNPLQDIPLFGVLHSPVGGFSDEQIAMLRAGEERQKRRLYDCLRLTAEGAQEEGLARQCRDFLELLERFRAYAVYLSIHSLLERFLGETGYLLTVSAMPGGDQRRRNVEMLLSMAERFEKTSYFGLFHFIRYIEQLEKYEVDYGEAGGLDENADTVRIMSIHKSKGLEFPICFVAGLSKQFNRRDVRQPVLMDMDLGLAIDCIDPSLRTRRVTLKKNVLSQKLYRDSMGEELRVLYVAMTRAEEKLILTGQVNPEKAEEEGGAPGPLEARCFLDLVLPVWRETDRAIRRVEPQEVESADTVRFIREEAKRQRLCLEQLSEGTQEEGRAFLERIQTPYAHENLAELFVKTTVSELKMAGIREQEEEEGVHLFEEAPAVPYLPRFIQEREENVGGALRGSAYHRLLELFDFGEKDPAAWTRQEVQTLLEEKMQERTLSREYGKVIQPAKIVQFLHSSLARRMCRAQAAGQLFKEQPFVLGIAADQLKEELPEEETVLIQGIIDVYFEEDGQLVVADYKTDAVDQAEELVRRYRIQLEYYAQALERLTGKPVKEKILYSFALAKEILLSGEGAAALPEGK